MQLCAINMVSSNHRERQKSSFPNLQADTAASEIREGQEHEARKCVLTRLKSGRLFTHTSHQ